MKTFLIQVYNSPIFRNGIILISWFQWIPILKFECFIKNVSKIYQNKKSVIIVQKLYLAKDRLSYLDVRINQFNNINNYLFETGKQFKYLGIIISYCNTLKMKSRIEHLWLTDVSLVLEVN